MADSCFDQPSSTAELLKFLPKNEEKFSAHCLASGIN